MQIAVITTKRPDGVSYVEDTVQQLVKDTRSPAARGSVYIDLFTDDWEQHVDFHAMPQLPVKWLTRDLHPTLRELRDRMDTGSRRAAINFLNALMTGWGDLVIFEDDINIKSDWYGKLIEVRNDSKADFISMYWTGEGQFEVKHHAIENAPTIGWRNYRSPNRFHGTLGIFLSTLARIRLARFVQESIAAHVLGVRELPPFDLMVQAWLNTAEYGSQAIAVGTFPALVDHRGDVSAIRENQSHGPRRSPGF